jgi:hypothetical protein
MWFSLPSIATVAKEKMKSGVVGICSMHEKKNLHCASRILKDDRPVFWETGWINVKLFLRLTNYITHHDEIWWDVGVALYILYLGARWR